MSDSSPIGSVAILVSVLAVAALGGDRVDEAAARPEMASTPSAAAQPRSVRTARANPIDLNTATEAELESLPRVGPALARRIVEHRVSHGPYRTVDELDAVKGVGPRLLERLRPLVRVAAALPQNRSMTNPQRITSESSSRPEPGMVPRP